MKQLVDSLFNTLFSTKKFLNNEMLFNPTLNLLKCGQLFSVLIKMLNLLTNLIFTYLYYITFFKVSFRQIN